MITMIVLCMVPFTWGSIVPNNTTISTNTTNLPVPMHVCKDRHDYFEEVDDYPTEVIKQAMRNYEGPRHTTTQVATPPRVKRSILANNTMCSTNTYHVQPRAARS